MSTAPVPTLFRVIAAYADCLFPVCTCCPLRSMWSLGCICYELSTGTPLFDGQDEHDQIIRQVDLLGIPPVTMIEQSKKVRRRRHMRLHDGGGLTWN